MSRPGHCLCHGAIYGFRNDGDSCFMDAVLLAMFAFENSPFYEHLIRRDLVLGDNAPNVCDPDLVDDRILRLQIQELLRESVNDMLAGRRDRCVPLRQALGAMCRLDPEYNPDLSVGQHDPDELFRRLVDALNYAPTTYRLRQEYTNDPRRPEATVGRRPQNYQTAMLPSMPVADIEYTCQLLGDGPKACSAIQAWVNPRWERLSRENMARIDGTYYRYRRDRYQVLDADVVVLSVSRVDPRQQYDQRRAYPVDRTPVKMPATFSLANGQRYTLCAVVAHSGRTSASGHYTTVLRCNDGEWYLYDDMQTQTSLRENRLEPKEALEIMATQGVLYFYYPMPVPGIGGQKWWREPFEYEEEEEYDDEHEEEYDEEEEWEEYDDEHEEEEEEEWEEYSVESWEQAQQATSLRQQRQQPQQRSQAQHLELANSMRKRRPPGLPPRLLKRK